jgi:hypothetical protein
MMNKQISVLIAYLFFSAYLCIINNGLNNYL